jgi:uncharacterized integral membrane protein
VLVGAIALFALLNLQWVSGDFAVGSVTMPLVFGIAPSALIGCIAGYLLGRRQRRSGGGA